MPLHQHLQSNTGLQYLKLNLVLKQERFIGINTIDHERFEQHNHKFKENNLKKSDKIFYSKNLSMKIEI